MFKLVRVGKINTIIRNLNIRTGSKASLRVLWLIFFLFLFNHVIGCVWFYIASLHQKWIPPRDYIFGGTVDSFELY